MSDYPEVYDFEAEGKSTLNGALLSISAVQAKKYGTDEMVEKFIINVEDDSDQTVYAIWLDSAVLNRAFKEEARNRKAIGERFRDREKVTIDYLGKRQGEKYTYKDFDVTFEYAAPSLDAFDALAGDVPFATETESPFEEALVTVPAEEAPTSTPSDDDIPF